MKQALEGDGKIQAAGIDVTANEGRVTLWGTTATAAERNRAAQIAAQGRRRDLGRQSAQGRQGLVRPRRLVRLGYWRNRGSARPLES